MAEVRWWWQPPYMEEFENEAQENRIEQAKTITSYIEANPQLSQNLKGLIEEHFYLPRDVLVGASLIGLTTESPELGPLVEAWLDNEKTWWDRTKAVGRGTIRGALTAFDSLQDEIFKKPTLATQKYLNDKKYNDGVGLAGAMLQLFTNREAMQDWQKIKRGLGPSVGREALRNLTQGKRVNLGEGYFANSTVAEETDIYKEMIARGADPEQTKQIIQSYYGQDITNAERERDEGLSFKTRTGENIKLTPAAPLVANILEPGTKPYSIMTGIIDGAFTLLADPTILIGGYLNKAGKAVRSLDQSIALSRAGVINNAIRKTVHIPSARQYITQTKGGQKIVDQFVLADDYQSINTLLKGQGDATLHQALKNTNSRGEVQSLLIDAIEERQILNKLNPTSMIMRGKISSSLGRSIAGDFGQAVGVKGAIRKSIDESQLGRIFDTFPVPKLYVNDLNQSFFDLRDWMKFAKVDDDIANPALDKLADLAVAQKARILDPSIENPVNAVENMNEVLEIWNQVLTHIGDKFANVGLPEELVKGVRQWMSSIDQTRMYFVNELGELEWFVGSKYEIIPKEFIDTFPEVISPEDARLLTERIVSKFRKNKKVDTSEVDEILQRLQDASNNILEPEARQLINQINSGYYEGAEQAVLNIAEELGVGTAGRVPYGFTGKVSPEKLNLDNLPIVQADVDLITKGQKVAETKSAFEWADIMGVQAGQEFSTPPFGARFLFTGIDGKQVAVQVTRVRSIPNDIFRNPNQRVLLEDIISKEGITEQQLQVMLNKKGFATGSKAFQVEFKPLNIEGRYDANRQRMLELGLTDNLNADIARAEYDWGTKADKIKVELSDEVNKLDKSIQDKVKFSMTQLEEAEKAGSRLTAAKVSLQTQKDAIIAKYVPTVENISFARREIAASRGYVKTNKTTTVTLPDGRQIENVPIYRVQGEEGILSKFISQQDATDYLKLKQKEELSNPGFLNQTRLRQVNVNEKTTVTRGFYEEDDFDVETTKEVIESIVGTKSVGINEAIQSVDESIARINKQVENQVLFLENNVPKFKELNSLNAQKPPYSRLEQDFGLVKPSSDDFRLAAADNLANSDGALVVLSGADTPGQGLKSSKNFLENGKWDVSDDVDLSPGLYQGNIPHIVVNPNKVYTPDEIKEIQTFIKTNKIQNLGVVGSSGTTADEAAKLKTLLDNIIFQTESTDNLTNTIGNLGRTLDEYLTQTGDLGELSISEGEIRTLLDELVDELRNTNILSKIEETRVSKARPTAHLISEYYNDGFIPMPDARLFLRVFRPMRELGLRLRGLGKLPQEDFDKLLAKPVTNLAELALKDDRTLQENIKLWVKSARTKINLNVDDTDINTISEGLLTGVADGYMQRLWKPSVLLRPAWVLRVVGEEQLRMWAADLDNVFAHPLSAFAWVIGRKPQRTRQLLQDERKLLRDDYLADTLNLGRGQQDILSESLELSIEHQQALNQSHAGILFGLDPRRARGFKVIGKGDKGFYNSWSSEILQLHSDELASRIADATIVGSPGSQAFENAIQRIKDDFWQGELSQWRRALVANSDDDAKQLKKLILEDKKWSDSYVESVVARVHLKTGGKYRATEILPDGRIIPLDRENPRPLNPNNVIRYEIVETGDHELLRHIAKGFKDDTEHTIQIFNTKTNDYEALIFNNKMSRRELRKYATWLNNYKSDVVGDSFKVKASRFEVDRDYAARADQVIETLYAGLMGVPTNDLSRSSAFRQFYWRFIEGAYGNMDDAARASVFAQAQKMMGRSLPGSRARQYLKNLETMGKAQVDRAITVDDLRAIDDLAKSYALQETKALLYDLNRRHVIADQLRLVFPFGEVYLEIAGTWTKLLKNQKILFGRKMQRTVEAFRKPSVFGDNEDEGFFTTDAQTGQEMYNMSGFPYPFNLSRALNNPVENDVAINPITGRPDIGTPQVKGKMVGYASGLNMVAATVVPGLGPLVSLPASAMLPTNQTIDDVFFPYGRPEGDFYDPRFYVTSALPNWYKKILAAGGSLDKDLDRQYTNEVKTILRAMNTTGIFDDSSPAAEQESLQRAKKLASQTLLMKGIVQAIAPTGPVIKYEYNIGPEGSKFLDPTKIKDEDPNHHYFAEVLLSDAYYQFLAGADGDRVQATAQFIKVFGFDPVALLTSKTKKIRASSYTVEGGYFYKQNKELMDKHPDVAYYMFPDSPLDEFDYQAWADALAAGDRIDLTPEQYQQAIRQGQGSLAYENYRRMLFDGPLFTRVPLNKKFEQLYLFRLQLQDMFPGYGQTSTVAPSLDTNSKIELFNKFVATEKDTEVTLPDGSKTTVEELPAIQGAMQYITARQFLLAGIRQRYGANASISRAEASEARKILRNLASQLMTKYPDFYYVYYDLFRLETEEQSLGQGYYG